MVKQEDRTLSTNEVAEILGITRQRVLQLIEQGKLKAEKFASVYMIKESALKDVVERKPGRPRKEEKSNEE
jgi:excisionase family DNA binding protein